MSDGDVAKDADYCGHFSLLWVRLKREDFRLTSVATMAYH